MNPPNEPQERKMSETLFPIPEENEHCPQAGSGQPRMEKPDRQQIQMRLAALDDLLPVDHRARVVWEMVQQYDLSPFYARIRSIEGAAGRPAIEPRVLVAVWLFATLEGVVSARELARLCEEHLAYQWLLGGITVNYHTLADFRVECDAALEHVLTGSVAALMYEGLVSIEKTAQDGLRIRASAGASSFRRKPTLEECLRKAEAALEAQKARSEDGADDERTSRQQAAQLRQVREKLERVKQALRAVDKVAAKRAKRRDKRVKENPARASTTDPEARVMKMADGGFRPAFSGQLTVTMESRIIIGVEASNEADTQLLNPMLDQIEERCQQLPEEHYVDGGYRNNASFEQAAARGVAIYCPIPSSYSVQSSKKAEDVLPTDGPGVKAWKERMVTAEAKQKYRQRAATVEWANALIRLRGLYRLMVRGLKKVKTILLWYALAHNLVQELYLRSQRQAATS
jgi:transposase